MMEEVMCGWENFINRPSGLLHLRFLIQPAIDIIIAIIAGVKDTKAGNPPYLWVMFTNADYRRGLLYEGWKDARIPFIISLILDVIYQLVSLKQLIFLNYCLQQFFCR
jgi:hypothetical protein